MKIAVIGTHSTGKTCLTSKMFAYASKNGINAHYIQEVARSCPLPINDGFTTEAATWIMSKQIALEIEARAKKPDFIICDRSCFDPIVYAIKKFNYPRYRYSLLYQYAQSVLKTYDIIINVRPSSYEIKEDGIRSIDPDFQKDIYDLFEQEFKHMEFVFIHYKDRPPIPLHDKHHFMSSKEIFEDNLTPFFEYIFHKEAAENSSSSGEFIDVFQYLTRG